MIVMSLFNVDIVGTSIQVRGIVFYKHMSSFM